MKRNRLLVLAALGLIGASMPLSGQSRDGGRRADDRADRPVRADNLTMIAGGAIRMRERLDLTDDQVSALGGIRDRSRALSDELRAEMQAVREDVRGGDVTRNQIRDRMTALTERQREAIGPLRQQVDDVLDAEQEARLRQGAARVRAGAAQRTRAGPGRDASSARAGARSQRGIRAPQAARAPVVGRGGRFRIRQSAAVGRREGTDRQRVDIRRGR